jgi:hypothetical protein
MKRILPLIMTLVLIGLPSAAGEVTSLSHLFALGHGLVDSDGDGLADALAFRIVIPDQPTAWEAAAAADIAGRANLESLVADFDLVMTESAWLRNKTAGNVILIGSRLGTVKSILQREKTRSPLGQRDGAVIALSGSELHGLVLAAGSDDALLKTARAFFLRWPYFWEIWGREDGATYMTLERDLGRFLEKEGLKPQGIRFRQASYEFPSLETPHEALKRLSFASGQVKDLNIEIIFDTKENSEKAGRALQRLAADRAWGRRTEELSYPGCALLTLHCLGGRESMDVILPRSGLPKRLLTPAYKAAVRPESKGKEFDLLGLYTTKSALGDTDQDGLADNIETSIIVPQDAAYASLSDLTTRLVMSSAGASFPLVYLDKEVENPKSLAAPIILGLNSLSRELLKTGKLKLPALGPGQALAAVVPAAFAKSCALTLSGTDALGMEALLRYLGRTFPYLSDYGPGNPQLADVASEVDKFSAGEHGAAEAFFHIQIKKIMDELNGKDLENVGADFTLAEENPGFLKEAQDMIQTGLKPAKLKLNSRTTSSGKMVFEKEKEFTWEADDALNLVQTKLKSLAHVPESISVEAGLSESPEMRQHIKGRLEGIAAALGVKHAEVTVHSAYKQGFFWLLEDVLPKLKAGKPKRLVIRWASEKDDLGRMKRFYSEPTRWLQELYPIDELLARDLEIPLDHIEFTASDGPGPIYKLSAYDDRDALILEQEFSPHVRELPYLKALPEWGMVKVSTGWLKITADGAPVLDTQIECDLEKFWKFYQDDVLAPVYASILKKTGNKPAFSKQPYFKKLTVELWSSEPDFRLGLDEERVSSLEAMHDEVYFDTLDFLRGITDLDVIDDTTAEDTSRFSAPGNVMPIIHPSTEGRPPRVKVTFEEGAAPLPEMELKWTESGRDEASRKAVFPSFKFAKTSVPALLYNGKDKRVENLTIGLELDKEDAYGQLIDIIQATRELSAKKVSTSAFRFPGLGSLTLRLKFKDLEKEETLPVLPPLPETARAETRTVSSGPTVPDGILSPEVVGESVRRLDATGKVKAYTAGKSYEGRPIPVIELMTPAARYVSTPRLITFKPTIYLSGRQHANEVSSTSYILKLADLLTRDPAYADYPKKINFVLQPLENPDGASLAFDLQKITPDHSLHAGRYSSLGLEIGYQVGAAKPILPEAKVRRDLNAEWLPDIYLNLHGYPSHEWVQAFSNYSPYLFREYWIPKGWFAYYQTITNPFYRKWQEAGRDLEQVIVGEMQARADLRESNQKFYDRYYRWATRWQPHLDPLELHGGLNLFAKRRSSQEIKPDTRTRVTFVEETPELMDETAQNGWLNFLTQQGLTYLTAHIKYLARTAYDQLRLEEEVADRVRIQFFRSRPGNSPEDKKK